MILTAVDELGESENEGNNPSQALLGALIPASMRDLGGLACIARSRHEGYDEK